MLINVLIKCLPWLLKILLFECGRHSFYPIGLRFFLPRERVPRLLPQPREAAPWFCHQPVLGNVSLAGETLSNEPIIPELRVMVISGVWKQVEGVAYPVR